MLKKTIRENEDTVGQKPNQKRKQSSEDKVTRSRQKIEGVVDMCGLENKYYIS